MYKQRAQTKRGITPVGIIPLSLCSWLVFNVFCSLSELDITLRSDVRSWQFCLFQCSFSGLRFYMSQRPVILCLLLLRSFLSPFAIISLLGFPSSSTIESSWSERWLKYPNKYSSSHFSRLFQHNFKEHDLFTWVSNRSWTKYIFYILIFQTNKRLFVKINTE